MATHRLIAPGPFRAYQLPSRSEYELVDGHPLYVAPTGGSGSGPILDGGSVLRSDPKVKRAGVDPGFSPDDLNMRAPDLAIIPEDARRGWIPGVPPFAIEYADVGQDEEKLQEKITDFLARGTKLIWVVRLVGPRRVEVYEPGAATRTVAGGDVLTAPEFLELPIPAESLWDPTAADRVTLRNLLVRFGYQDVEAIREEGREQGREEGREEGQLASLRTVVRRLATRRGLALSSEAERRIAAETDPEVLLGWATLVGTVSDAADLFPE